MTLLRSVSLIGAPTDVGAGAWNIDVGRHAIERLGHDPRYPVTTDWPHLVTQLAQFIEHEVGEPACLVGHSLGGYLSMMVASRHPWLAQGVVVLDSPLLYGIKRAGLGLAKRLQLMPAVLPPSRVAEQRTERWQDLDTARRHFSDKPKFAAFHPEVLHDYLHHGLEGPGDGAPRRLSFRREVETAIYNTMPHDLLHEFRRHPHRCPMAFIGGTQSRELRAVGLRGTQRLFGPQISWIEGSHLYPFERPQDTADAVLSWLNRFEQPA